MKKVYLYTRVAPQSQNKHFSMQRQIQILKEYAQKKGYRIIRIFQDYGSARATERLAFEQMINEATQGKVKYILCMDLSRLSRDFKTFAKIIKLMDEKGVEILTPNYQYNNNLVNQILLNMGTAMSKNYSTQLSERIKRGILQKKIAEKVKAGV